MTDLPPPPAQLPRSENRSINLQLFSRWDSANIDTTSAGSSDPLTRGEFLYYDTKALIIQILRLSPTMAAKRPLNLEQIVKAASTSKNPVLVRKGIKIGDMLEELIRLKQISPKDSYALMTEEITQELLHLGNLAEKVAKEMKSLSIVYKTIQDHNDYLRSQLETYKAYLQNVRTQSGPAAQQKKTPKTQYLKFTHQKLENDGVICDTNVPENRYCNLTRRANIYFNLSSPFPGTFLISLHYKGNFLLTFGRDKAILEMDLKLDDLLEKQQLGVTKLDLEYVQFDVQKTLSLLNNSFLKNK